MPAVGGLFAGPSAMSARSAWPSPGPPRSAWPSPGPTALCGPENRPRPVAAPIVCARAQVIPSRPALAHHAPHCAGAHVRHSSGRGTRSCKRVFSVTRAARELVSGTACVMGACRCECGGVVRAKGQRQGSTSDTQRARHADLHSDRLCSRRAPVRLQARMRKRWLCRESRKGAHRRWGNVLTEKPARALARRMRGLGAGKEGKSGRLCAVRVDAGEAKRLRAVVGGGQAGGRGERRCWQERVQPHDGQVPPPQRPGQDAPERIHAAGVPRAPC